MRRSSSFETFVAMTVASLAIAASAVATPTDDAVSGHPEQYALTLDSEKIASSYTGRVWVILTQSASREPRQTVSWFSEGPIYAMDVEDWQPGKTLQFRPSMQYGDRAENLAEGTWYAQAVINRNNVTHDVLNAPGNQYSKPVEFEWPRANSDPIAMTIDQETTQWSLKDSPQRQFITVRSKLLSEFFGKDTDMRAALMTPSDYDASDKTKKYPTVYVVGGMGTNIRTRYWMNMRDMLAAYGMDAFVVFIDADCATGHHVFADSANNGPVGTALVEEFIPHLEKKYNMIPETGARFVTGHSSGGWSSLWLQITYPETFGGCWSTSPDPVDFTSFQLVNIYEPNANLYVNKDGEEMPVSRKMGNRQLMTRKFCALEDILGRGGQMQSFEAVFSPRGADGKPAQFWNRKTGAIDPAVAEAWKKYDIVRLLKQNWPERAPALSGKLHLFCGDKDTFHLERAFTKLADFLKEVDSDAYIEIVPGAGHTLPQPVFVKGYEQMAEKFAAWQEQRQQN